jgi:hypothetical protein
VDGKKRSWEVSVSVTTLNQVKSLLGIDLLTIIDKDSPLLTRLIEDPVLLCNLLYVTVKEQADALKITDEEFGRGLSGDTLDDATRAFLEGLACFFRSTTKRTALKAVSKSVFAAEDLLTKRLETEIGAGVFDRIAEAAARKTLEKAMAELSAQASAGDSSGASPDGSASTPAP